MDRVLETEWLDELPATDEKAQRSRRDLQRINWLMGNAGLLRRALGRSGALDWAERVVELGAGDGTLLWRILRKLQPRGQTTRRTSSTEVHSLGCNDEPDALNREHRARPLQVVLVDCKQLVAPVTQAELERLGCEVELVTADAFEWLRGSGNEGETVILANLFLHHCGESRLQELLELIAGRSRCFIACEPRRAAVPLAASRLLGLLGANGVTRHDAPISVRAGFKGLELRSLWPQDGAWSLREEEAGPFSHLFTAIRRPACGPRQNENSR